MMWIVYDPNDAAILGKYYSRKRAIENYYCKPARTLPRPNCLIYEKVDMAHYDEWYTMALLKAKNFSGAR